MNAVSNNIIRFVLLIAIVIAGNDMAFSQPSAQIKGIKSQFETINRIQWQKIRRFQTRPIVPGPKPNLKSVPKMPKINVPRPFNIYDNKVRFKGKTKAQIDSIKRVDKEKQRFYSDFLGQLNLVASEINHRDSLLTVLDNAIISGDSILPADLLTPEFVAYAKDAIVGSPYEIALYNSLYDDLICRNDSSDIFGKYRIWPGLDSHDNANLRYQIYGDTLYLKIVNTLRDRLSSDVEQYLYLYDLVPFTVSLDSINSIIAIASTGPEDSNMDIIRIFAEVIATGNAVYSELQDVRNLRDSTAGNASSLYTVRLVEMKLRLEDSFDKYNRLKITEIQALTEINKKIFPSCNMGKYNPKTLHLLLSFLLKDEWESLTEIEQ